jgi:DNA invertase Pin-like site-specific DNA recombinase
LTFIDSLDILSPLSDRLEMKMNAVFGYGRVSTEGQVVDNQKLEIERAGWNVDFWFADVGVSGGRCAMERPEFVKMMGQIRSGETLVVSKVDRLGRDAIDVGQTVKMLQERQVKVVVLNLGGVELTSATGKMMLMMLSAMAEMERDLLRERIEAGLVRARTEGVKFGPPMKVAEEDRLVVKQLLKDGMSVSELSRRYGVSRGTIVNIRNE